MWLLIVPTIICGFFGGGWGAIAGFLFGWILVILINIYFPDD
jgi:hypothetical protein